MKRVTGFMGMLAVALAFGLVVFGCATIPKEPTIRRVK
jgi:hypothetical protein